MQINTVTFKIAHPQVVIEGLTLISSGLATNFIRFINDSASPF